MSGGNGVNRMELQTLLRRTREASGEMQIFMQESYRLIQQDSSARPATAPQYQQQQPFRNAVPSIMRSGPGLAGAGPGRLGGMMPTFGGGGALEEWPMPPSTESSGSLAPVSWGDTADEALPMGFHGGMAYPPSSD